MFNFKDKKVLITGATGGIGSKISELFSNNGAIVGLCGRDKNKLDDFSSKLTNKSFVFPCNLSDINEVEKLFEIADKEMNGIDILVCNAGITKDTLTMRMSNSDFTDVITVNLESTFILNREAVKKMIKRKYGRIINISSVVGISGNPGQSNYSASKAGIIGMSKSIALEVATRGITVNCIAPGFIETPMTDVLNDDQKSKILNNIPMNKMGTPDDIANSVIFLASDAASYITGQTLHVNGGMLMI